MPYFNNFHIISFLIFTITTACFSQTPKFPFKFIQINEWGIEGSLPGEMKEPESIFLDPGGYLYIADTGNHRVQKFDMSGEFLIQTGGFGWGHDQFDTPQSIISINGLDVFVSDFYNSRIKRYDKNLNLVAIFSVNNENNSKFNIDYAGPVCQSPFGNIYCLDRYDNKIIKYSLQGEPLSVIGDINSGTGRLIEPTSILIDSKGTIFVSDKGSKCIKVYDLHGNFLHNIGKDFFEEPVSIIELFSKILLIYDRKKEELSLFTKENILLGIHDTIFIHSTITDMASFNNRLIILDKTNGRVKVFQINTLKE